MGIEHFVGRDDAMKRIQDVLTGREAAGGKLTVQSIEGPGGIGKTFLFNNAISRVDLTNRNYLILRIDGSAPPPEALCVWWQGWWTVRRLPRFKIARQGITSLCGSRRQGNRDDLQ